MNPHILWHRLTVLGLAVATLPVNVVAQTEQREPHTFFQKYIKLTDGEINKIESGQAIAARKHTKYEIGEDIKRDEY